MPLKNCRSGVSRELFTWRFIRALRRSYNANDGAPTDVLIPLLLDLGALLLGLDADGWVCYALKRHLDGGHGKGTDGDTGCGSFNTALTQRT